MNSTQKQETIEKVFRLHEEIIELKCNQAVRQYKDRLCGNLLKLASDLPMGPALDVLSIVKAIKEDRL